MLVGTVFFKLPLHGIELMSTLFFFRFEANQSLIEPGLEVWSASHCVGAAEVPSTMSIQGAAKKVGAFWSMISCCVSYVTLILQK